MTKGENGGSHDAAQPTIARVCLATVRASCVAFTTLGVTLPWLYVTPLFGPYRDALELSVDAPVDRRTFVLVLGITGGSVAGKWLAHLALLGHLARGERWAWRASVAGLGSWLLVDSVVSLAHGAWWNVVFVNVVPAVLVGAPLLALGGHARLDAPAPEIARASPAWWVALACGVGAITGVAIALGGTSALFGPWRAALAAAHSGGNASPAAEAVVASFFGPIGGSTLGQFLMLAALARHRVSRGDVRALDWTIASFLGWLVVDSGWSLAADGAFNVLLVNAPFALVVLPVLAWARTRIGRDAVRSAV